MHPDTGEDVYEHEADIFANYLLAPAPLVLLYSKLDIDTIHDDFRVSYGCARSVKDRTEKRRAYGSWTLTEYEQRILAFCFMKGGGHIVCA
jgi:Zn-dependent peptidase ImmA (M78 family)